MDARFDAPMPPLGFGESLFPCWTTRNMLRASPSRSRVTRESQCSRQQRLDPRTALAERGPPGGTPRTGQRTAARFASYCPRFMGSVIEGEDVVQDTLARAFVALQDLEEAPPLRPSCSAHSTSYAATRCAWLKNRATPTRTLSTQPSPTPLVMLMRKDAVKTAVSRFAELPTLHRSVVILRRQLPCRAAG